MSDNVRMLVSPEEVEMIEAFRREQLFRSGYQKALADALEELRKLPVDSNAAHDFFLKAHNTLQALDKRSKTTIASFSHAKG